MDIREFAEKYLQPYRMKGDEINAKWCPLCQRDRPSRGDHYKFFLNTNTGVYYCHRQNECGAKGPFWDLCKKFDEITDEQIQWSEQKKVERRGYKKPMKIYKPPEKKIESIGPEVEAYIKSRGISKATCDRFLVGEIGSNIAFRFYDEKGHHCLTKFRFARKLKKDEIKTWCEPEGKPVLFGMQFADPGRPLIITEGEFDMLAVEEACGPLANAVSLPLGAKKYEWIDLCWDFLQQFNKIILAFDNDIPGQETVVESIPRLGEEVCYTVEFGDCKDSNEVLFRHGPDALKKIINEAKGLDIEGIINVGDIEIERLENRERIRTSIKRLDETIDGFGFGEVTVWTGHKGNGKSTLLGQVILESIEQGYKACVYSGELTKQRFHDWMTLQAAGGTSVKHKISKLGKDLSEIEDKNILAKINNWFDGKLYLLDNTMTQDNTEDTGILRLFKIAARRHGCRIFLVDNLMSARYKSANENDFYRRQSIFIADLIAFAQKLNAHVHLVAHPNKRKEGEFKNINIIDKIGGSGDIGNQANNVITVHKIIDQDSEYNAGIAVLKNREFYGECFIPIGLRFDAWSRRFYREEEPGEGLNKKYSWED